MEQQATTTLPVVNQTEVITKDYFVTTKQKAAAKKAAAKAIRDAKKAAEKDGTTERVITTNLILKSGINETASFHLATFPKSLGTLLNKVGEKFTVSLFGGKVSVPSITAKTDNKDRVLAFLKSLTNVIFDKMEMQQILEAKETDKIIVLSSLQKSGFKFTKYNKIEVSAAIELWAKFKQSEKKVSVQTVIAKNTGLIARTNVNTELYKVLKAANLADITGLEVVERKTLGLPAKIEDKK